MKEKKVKWKQDRDADMCKNCYQRFNLVRRKHHCRSCGDIFCDDCTKYRKPIPILGYMDPIRHCSQCYFDIT